MPSSRASAVLAREVGTAGAAQPRGDPPAQRADARRRGAARAEPDPHPVLHLGGRGLAGRAPRSARARSCGGRLCDDQRVHEVAPGIAMVDTLLGGMEGVTSAYLVSGDRPALVDAGARTTAQTVRDALAAAGLGPADLAWIVLTHVHLDHCGATGILAEAFPGARVVVHRRGARHLSEPGRLVAGSAAVYGGALVALRRPRPDPGRPHRRRRGRASHPHRPGPGPGDASRPSATPATTCPCTTRPPGR